MLGETSLHGLNVLGVGSFTGNIWDGKTKVTVALFLIRKQVNRKERLCK